MWPALREHPCLSDGAEEKGAERHGFLFHLLPGSTPLIPVLCQARVSGSRLPTICPSSAGPWPVLQAEGWVLPSWFQLGTRKLARGIFSPGFWRSQRSFILGGAGHSGTQLANAGLMGYRVDRQAVGQGVGSGRRGAKVTLPIFVAGGNRGYANSVNQVLSAMLRMCPCKLDGSSRYWGTGWVGGTCRSPPPPQAWPRPSTSMAGV